MAVKNFVLLTQATCYVLTFLLSLCLIIPLVFHHIDFNGHCLLFSTGEWRETDGQLLVNWANNVYCNISIFVGCAVIIISIVQFFRMAIFLYRDIDSTFLSAFIDTLVGSVCMIIIFFVAIALTIGFQAWCETMTIRFSSCEEATITSISKNFTSSGFFIQMGTAQFSAWAAWVTWVAVTVLAVVKVCKHHQQENIMVSMIRERQRLINDGDSPKTIVS